MVGSLEDESLGVLTETVTGLGSNPTRIDTGNSPIDDTSGNTMLLVLLGAVGVGTAGVFMARSRRATS